jgi:hypothetical protein
VYSAIVFLTLLVVSGELSYLHYSFQCRFPWEDKNPVPGTVWRFMPQNPFSTIGYRDYRVLNRKNGYLQLEVTSYRPDGTVDAKYVTSDYERFFFCWNGEVKRLR